MRDITKDLEERIEDVEKERAQLQRQISVLDQKAETLTTMLESERARWPEQASLPGLVSGNGAGWLASPFSRFLQHALSDGRPRKLHELKLLATNQGIDFKGKSSGRTLHFALVGMQQNGLVERLKKTREWKLGVGKSD